MIRTNEPYDHRMGRLLTVFGCLLWLVLASPTLIESDAYRYAAAMLMLIGFYFFWRMPVRPRMDWLAWLCVGWGLFVLGRFAFIYEATPGHDVGASDWLFAFPLFFPALGFAFSLYERQSERLIAAFFSAALVLLAVTTGYVRIFNGETVRPLIMNNQIHGAVACGLLITWAAFWLLHYLTTPSANRAFARFSYVVAPLVIALCLIAIYGAKSKGVWLALSVTLPVLAAVALGYFRHAKAAFVLVTLFVLLCGGLYAVRHNLSATAGPTIAATVSMVGQIASGGAVDSAVSGTIDADNTPISMDERLQLWSNGLQVFSSAPVFGWGNEWLERWHQTRYANVQYTLLHNGYLEILVRFGLFGAIVMSVILAGLIASVWRAWRANLIPRAAFHAYAVSLFFFALTILTNSNNRLAIGESLALGSAAFACALRVRLKPVAYRGASESSSAIESSQDANAITMAPSKP